MTHPDDAYRDHDAAPKDEVEVGSVSDQKIVIRPEDTGLLSDIMDGLEEPVEGAIVIEDAPGYDPNVAYVPPSDDNEGGAPAAAYIPVEKPPEGKVPESVRVVVEEVAKPVRQPTRQTLVEMERGRKALAARFGPMPPTQA